MKRIAYITVLGIMSAILAVSCRQIFTTSFGTVLARDSLQISSSTSIDDLIALATSGYAEDPNAAKAILDALGGKSTSDIQDLSVADQAEILNLATTASLDLAAVTDLLAQAADAADTNALVSQILDSFDTSVNLDAVLDVLNDTTTMNEAPIDSIVFASSVVLAAVASDIGVDAIMDIMSTGAGTIGTYTSDPELTAELTTILNVVTILEARPDAGDADFVGFNLIDLLKGTQ